jgi:formylglycine-generating enzyme
MIMGENPSKFKNGDESITLTIQGKGIQMQPNHPVEMVSWNDIQKFIANLNEMSKSGDPRLKEMIPDHEVGMEYRLPTEAEWEFTVRDRGRANGTWYFGEDKTKLSEHAWFLENSNDRTHAVGQLKSLIVDGNKFYDLYGNVWEWVQDRSGEYPSGEVVDPQGPQIGSDRVIRGGGWSYDAVYCQSAYRCHGSPSSNGSGSGLGFRLARTKR